MIFNIIVIGAVLLIAYLWASRGLYSAFLHLLCTIVAGAIAFALWEPLVYGLLLNLRDDIAWTVGLVAPFVVALALLRLGVDAILKKAVQFDDATNFVGGAVCGALSGVIAVGIFTLGVSFLRLPPDFMGYRAAAFADNTKGPGLLVEGSPLWLPADRLVEGFYGMMSEGSLATATPLADRAPDLAVQGSLLRYTFRSAGRSSLQTGDFEVLGQYEVAAPSVDALLTDSFSLDPQGNPIPQRAVDLEGDPYPAGSKLVGVLMRFSAGAKEKQGQVVIGPGQIRLLAQGPDGATKSLLPVAFVNQADPLALNFRRWRFDSDGVYAASVGGAADTTMAFEFVVPPEFTAEEVQVRNVRASLDALPDANRPAGNEQLVYASPEERDASLRDFSLLSQVGVRIEGAEIESTEDTAQVRTEDSGRDSIVRVSEFLPLNGQFNRSRRGTLDVNNDNEVVDGEQRFTRAEYSEPGLQENLRVSMLSRTPDTRVVQVDVGLRSPVSLLGRAFQTATQVVPPVLVDTLGRQYQPIGYVFQQGEQVTIRFEPGDPITGLSQIPGLSSSRDDQQLILLFRVTEGAELASFAFGGKAVADFTPAIRVGR
ncbi:MAG: CvpA family protein [Phycisphaerales bacterium]